MSRRSSDIFERLTCSCLSPRLEKGPNIFTPKIPAKDMISGWLVQQTAAALGLWLVPVMVIFALASCALLRKASVWLASMSRCMMFFRE